jgi:hypothetical protein
MIIDLSIISVIKLIKDHWHGSRHISVIINETYKFNLQSSIFNKIYNLAAWKKMWGMQFHPEKCISLSVTRSQKPFHTSYTLKGHTLESVTTQAVDQIPPHPKLLAAFCYSRKLRPTSRCSLLFHNC